MGSNCNNCNTMEDEIYWKCFKTVQFSQILSHHFHRQLEVPKRFVKNLREKLGNDVSLKGPSGTIWKVGLVTERDSLYFKVGWNKFIQYNSLEENDMLIFKYNGSSNFDVLMFDGKSMCEKETSYFVRKCVHLDVPREGRKGKNETSEKDSDQVPRGRHSPQNEDGGQVEESFNVASASDDDNCLEWTPSNKSKKAYEEAPSLGRRWATANSKIHKRKGAVEARPVPLEILSNRRAVTEEEKANAVQRANAEASDESLAIVMKDYHVYRHFWPTLPAWWSNNHLPPTHQIIKLQLEGKVWPVKFYKKVTGGLLNAGWKNFALDNYLEEGDVCLFNLVTESSSIVIDVKIFRVVEEVVPPTPLRSQSSSRRGRPPSSSQRAS